ncbi:hypothetical protein [Streptomyces sp. 8N706]|uniref:hypothetical protein n=1 Tax=Streptomyces sp. 8N706 TaxID=3457416 RepID=UPI003FD387E7
MSIIPLPEPAPKRLDPLESALLSAWNNSPDVMDDYHDEEPEDPSGSAQDQ